MKRPSFQFYPSDWLRDTALRSCSIGARGLWIDMICFMHEGNPYGHLKVGNKVILPSNLCGMVGATLEDVEGWLDELKQASVYGLADDGSMFSRRMIKDENLRNMRAAGGKLGGNPALKDKTKVNLKVKQNPTPSSSSSSSSSNIHTDQPDGFDLVYQAYPKKVGKPAALRAWKAAKVKPDEVDLILKDIESRKLSRDWQKDDGQYIPNPSTYLNQRRWEDLTSSQIVIGGLIPGAI
jgi:hypothetical protein